jgi:hypothetical protein
MSYGVTIEQRVKIKKKDKMPLRESMGSIG